MLMPRNRLAGETSPYLLQHAGNPVDWHPWGAAAIEMAKAKDRPILLSIGYSACHWCHVMAHESFEDVATAELMNRLFVNVKVDREERPDLDKVYQIAHQMLAHRGGGWPLTMFLAPDDLTPFYGGTYFPKESRHGLPAFGELLERVAAFYRDNRDSVRSQNAALRGVFADLVPPSGGSGQPLGRAPIAAARRELEESFDGRYGGFGGAPKFPHTATLDLLLRRAFRTGDPDLLGIVTRTLDHMARGGIRDHLGGGFHRYATDARWIVPHFEKMLYDNAGLLGAYVQAWLATGRPLFRSVAEGTAGFLMSVLSDPPRGGFYGSQDADVGPHDDGSYFTWTEGEARAALTGDEFAVASEHFHLTGPGEMHDAERRHVLYADRDVDVIAVTTRRDVAELERLLDGARQKLGAARASRPAPYVDTALYANWNGMAIVAMLAAASAFGERGYQDAALRALERFLAEAYRPEHGFAHTPGGTTRTLDDQAQMALALFAAYETTAEARYLAAARATMEVVVRDYWDGDAFLDVPRGTTGPGLDVALHPLQDAPTPSANGVAALVLLRLSRVLGTEAHRQIVGHLLEGSVAGLAAHGLHASALFVALDDFLHEPAHVTIIGAPHDPRTAALREAALRSWRPDRVISHHGDGRSDAPLPEAVQAMLVRGTEPTAYVCAGAVCAAPVRDPAALAETLSTFGRR